MQILLNHNQVIIPGEQQMQQQQEGKQEPNPEAVEEEEMHNNNNMNAQREGHEPNNPSLAELDAHEIELVRLVMKNKNKTQLFFCFVFFFFKYSYRREESQERYNDLTVPRTAAGIFSRSHRTAAAGI